MAKGWKRGHRPDFRTPSKSSGAFACWNSLAVDRVVVETTRCGRLNQISEEIMYKFAIAMLLLSTPAFAQDKNEPQPNMPPTNMKNTVIPKSGGEQTPATTPTTAAEANRPGTNADRPSKTGPEQTSVPNASPPATITQTTGATDQEPKVKEMNEEEKKKIEKEGK
jgi:cytoskeletal protein RodZ